MPLFCEKVHSGPPEDWPLPSATKAWRVEASKPGVGKSLMVIVTFVAMPTGTTGGSVSGIFGIWHGSFTPSPTVN